MLIKTILKEPLLYFLLFGGCIYYLFDYSSGVDKTKDVITISKGEVEELRLDFSKKYSHMPSVEVLDILIDTLYQKKALLAEAYRLELPKDDKKIQDILLKKMLFIIQSKVNSLEPSEEELFGYYKKNIKDYSQKYSLSFFDIELEKMDKDDFLFLKKLPIDKFDKKKIYKDITKEQLTKIFGNYFSTKVFHLKKGILHKAIDLKNRYHYVYVLDYKVGKPLAFDEVEQRVYQDYKDELLELGKDKVLQKILSEYRLVKK
jgi:parvulin-like peptidyl-prolyl isomerase